jgi:dTDP-4-dehydrorhamnose 3,5-epimerase
MKVTPLKISGVKLIEPKVFEDQRGSFFESFNQKRFNELVDPNINFVQDNQSRSEEGVLRGLHCQRYPYAQGKLVRVLLGEIFDVAVDLRKESKTFGHWLGLALSEENKKQLWVPEGFAHGFLVTSEEAVVSYKVTNYYNKDNELAINYNDEELAIDWPNTKTKQLSQKDSIGLSLANFRNL